MPAGRPAHLGRPLLSALLLSIVVHAVVLIAIVGRGDRELRLDDSLGPAGIGTGRSGGGNGAIPIAIAAATPAGRAPAPAPISKAGSAAADAPAPPRDERRGRRHAREPREVPEPGSMALPGRGRVTHGTEERLDQERLDGTGSAAVASPAAHASAATPGGGPPGLGTGSGDAAGAGGGAGAAGPGSGAGDLQASCVACPVPDYPRQARRRRWQGVVDLRLRLDGDGRVIAVEVARQSGFDVLDDAAVAAARRSRFRLGGSQGAGGVWGQMRYRFELGGG